MHPGSICAIYRSGKPNDEYDSPWKEALEKYLRPCLDFSFPAISAAIDWSAALEFLDKEFREIDRDADLGRQTLDLLVNVRLRDGTQE